MSKPIRKVKALVTFDWPEDASLQDIKDYIVDAIRSYGGGLDPSNPMFDDKEGLEVEVLGEPL